jgi:hypothetical protein
MDDPSQTDNEAFQRALEQREPGLIAEYWAFLRGEGKWWALPILLAILGLGVLVLASSSAIGGLIYPFF